MDYTIFLSLFSSVVLSLAVFCLRGHYSKAAMGQLLSIRLRSVEKAPSTQSTSSEQLKKLDPLGWVISRISALAPSKSVEPQVYPLGYQPKTKAERKELGLYPDYAALSGVPWPKAYLDFDPERALPRPYRPFRWPYHQTMALSKLEPDWWLEIENTYKERMAVRKEIYRRHGKLVLDALPGEEVETACRELMEFVVMWLEKRYPKWFSLVEDPGVDGGKILINKILGTSTELDRGIAPLMVLLENVPEDFVLVLPRITSLNPSQPPKVEYTFRAGVICSSIGWSLSTKLGLSLHDIHHTTGSVPHYATKMSFSMDRFFAQSLPPSKPIQRGSWSLGLGKPFFGAPGDKDHEAKCSVQNPNITLEDVSLRVDWQTLRRLPVSGAVCFNLKTMFTELADLRGEKGVPGLVGKLLREGDREIMKYKGVWHVEHLVIPTMERWEREQRESGMVDAKWDVGTLEQTPFYEGWEEQWGARQGF